MDTPIEKLGIKLQEWQTAVAVRLRAGGNRVRQCIMEILDLADRDVLDLSIVKLFYPSNSYCRQKISSQLNSC